MSELYKNSPLVQLDLFKAFIAPRWTFSSQQDEEAHWRIHLSAINALTGSFCSRASFFLTALPSTLAQHLQLRGVWMCMHFSLLSPCSSMRLYGLWLWASLVVIKGTMLKTTLFRHNEWLDRHLFKWNCRKIGLSLFVFKSFCLFASFFVCLFVHFRDNAF